MTSIEQADSWIGRTAVDNAGAQIGMVTTIWVDDESGQPEWASVRSTLGGSDALVPLGGAAPLGGGLQLAYNKDEVAHAPRVAEDGQFGAGDKERIAAYYGTAAGESTVAPEAGWMDRLSDLASPGQGSAAISQAGSEPAPEAAPAPEQKRRRFARKSA